MVKSIKNAEHYTWGGSCDGWHLIKTDPLSVIQERMPKGSAEDFHFHNMAQQVFYILSGVATFYIDHKEFIVCANESIYVPHSTIHKIMNNSEDDLHFLVISAPKAHGDRVTV
ncbi:MAG: cupin [Flaviaesturariibacter sp.]|nr:cupin [Flaviaesturariibacter sp.]